MISNGKAVLSSRFPKDWVSEEELGIWLPIEELGMKSILGLLLLCEKMTLTSTSCMSSGSSGSEKRSRLRKSSMSQMGSLVKVPWLARCVEELVKT